jgi:protein-L-isoaspartate(D-aspartate) O-methyltransferase
VHRDISVAVDEARALFNGAPGVVAAWIDRLDVREGDRVLHIGCGTGYYSAILGAMTGPSGTVTAIDIDAGLAARARDALVDMPWIDVSTGDGLAGLPSNVDVLLVHAGASHLVRGWLDCLRPGSRAAIPLTCTFPGQASTLSKGFVLFLTRTDQGWAAAAGDLVVIYALAGARGDSANAALGRALARGLPTDLRSLRTDAHAETDACWLHATDGVCLSR